MWQLIRRIYGGTLIALFVFCGVVCIASAYFGVVIIRDAESSGEYFIGLLAWGLTYGYGYFAWKFGGAWYEDFA